MLTIDEAMRDASRGDGCAADIVNEEVVRLREWVRALRFKLGECCPFCGWDKPQCDCKRPAAPTPSETGEPK